MTRPTPDQAIARLAILTHVTELLRECRMADKDHFPILAKKIRSAIKSADGARRNAERFAPIDVRLRLERTK